MDRGEAPNILQGAKSLVQITENYGHWDPCMSFSARMKSRETKGSSSSTHAPLRENSFADLCYMSWSQYGGPGAPVHGLHHTPSGSLATVIIFVPIQSPFLRSIEPTHVSAFLREGERYKLEVLTNVRQVPPIYVTSYEVCIERVLLRHLIFMGEFHFDGINVTIDNISGDQFESHLR